MTPVLRLVAILWLFTATAVSAQGQSLMSSSDTTAKDLDAVTAYSIRSGKLMLSSKANTKPVALPDGVYTNQSDLTIALLDGRVTRMKESTGQITEIASMRLNKDRLVKLTPATNALMAVTDVTLPSGTFKSEDGLSSVTVVYGRPTAFTIPGVI
ncbi:MAG: hypothetical protein ABI556_09935 [Gemmatimonadales bacterium]